MIKAYTCGARAVFPEEPQNCPLKKHRGGYPVCEDGQPCDVKPVAVIPWAKHEEVRAALAAAEEEAIDLWICPRYVSDSAPGFGCTYYIEESKRADQGKGPGCYKYSVCRATLVKFVPWEALKSIQRVSNG